jgi:hypothetical protein
MMHCQPQTPDSAVFCEESGGRNNEAADGSRILRFTVKCYETPIVIVIVLGGNVTRIDNNRDLVAQTTVLGQVRVTSGL